MSGKTFDDADFNKVHPLTIRNLVLGFGVLLVVVIAGLLLQPIIAERSSDAATAPTLALFPMEEAERYSTGQYAPVRIGGEPAAAGLAISPIEEAERFSVEWYAWQVARGETTAPIKVLALFPIEEAERYSAEHYAPPRVGDELAPARLALSPIEEAERFNSEWYQWRAKFTAP